LIEVFMPLAMVRRSSKQHFILQQGLDPPGDPESESILYSALQFQPRFIGVLVLAGVAFQSPAIFFLLGAALSCSAIAPRWNPFNALYNYTLGARRGSFLLRSAPPRMFAEAIAGCLALAIAALAALGQSGAAVVLEAVFVLANASAVFSGFCLGAFLFFRLKGGRAVMCAD
jgi:hypothetical protein